MKSFIKLYKYDAGAALLTAFILPVTLIAMPFTSEVTWDLANFVIKGVMYQKEV